MYANIFRSKYVRNAHTSRKEGVRTSLWCLVKGMDFDKYMKAVKVGNTSVKNRGNGQNPDCVISSDDKGLQ